MNKYVLMLAAAGLIAAAPAYYAFQAQAEEAPVEATVDCDAVPEGEEIPAECVEAPAADAAPATEAAE